MLASHLLGEEAVWRPRAWALVQHLLRCSIITSEQFVAVSHVLIGE